MLRYRETQSIVRKDFSFSCWREETQKQRFLPLSKASRHFTYKMHIKFCLSYSNNMVLSRFSHILSFSCASSA